MRFNLWKQLRLAGAVVIIAGTVIHNSMASLAGLALVGIGVINGLLSVELRLDALEKENDNAPHSEG